LHKNTYLLLSPGSIFLTDVARSALDKNGIFNMILEQIRLQKPKMCDVMKHTMRTGDFTVCLEFLPSESRI